MGGPRVVGVAALVLACACASGLHRKVEHAVERRDGMAAARAYAELREHEGADPDLLAEVARALLEQAAWSEHAGVRNAALVQLALAGPPAHPVLERLAESPGVTVKRARALSILVERGHGWAEPYLHALLDARDPAVVAEAVTTIDPRAQWQRLVGLLEHPAAEVRRSAAGALAEAPVRARVRWALVEAARRDPEASVRAAAVSALGAQGPDAAGGLRDRLSDPSTMVRLAAVGALLRAEQERGAVSVATLLEAPPSPAGIEAARRLLLAGQGGRSLPRRVEEDARAYLRAVLRAGAGRLRAQAGVAVVSLPDASGFEDVLVEALETQEDPEVRFQLARALLGQAERDPRAVAALEAVAATGGIAGVQSAGLLARRGNPRAVDMLARFLRSGPPMVRRTAARALACDAGRPDAAREGLGDSDPIVRVHVAGAILRCVD